MKITLATKITIARIFLIIPTVAVYVAAMLLGQAGDYPLYIGLSVTSAVLFAVLSGTDFVDGNIARRTHTVTDLGKFLDPLADKIVVFIMLFLIIYFNDIKLFAYDSLVVALLAGVVVSRELAIGVFRAIASKKGLVLAADIYGKLKTVFLDIGVCVLMIAGLHISLAYIGFIAYAIGSVLAVYSGYHYVAKNLIVFTDGSSGAADKENGAACGGETEKCDDAEASDNADDNVNKA